MTPVGSWALSHESPPTPPQALPLARLLVGCAEAVQAVAAGRSLDDALARVDAVARPGVQALSFTALRQWGLSEALRRLMAPKQPAPAVDALLRSSLALLLPSDEPPYAEHTVVDQAVAAARQGGAQTAAAAPFINAVLRRFLREREALLAQARRSVPGEFNHPDWWVARLKADWPAHWAQLLRAAQARPPMTLRVNARRGDAASYALRLAQAGRKARQLGTHGLVLEAPCAVQLLPGFAQGDVSVQDESAQRAAPLLLGRGLAPGARVLDACAAPGGKTAHLLELADLDLLALDVDAQRLQRVHETLARLGLRATVQAGDARTPTAWWDGRPFDAILLDAPCTASGITRRHPDVRWLRRPEDVAALAQIQAQMLDALWTTLKPGGRLLYATCSVFRAEGQQQVEAFLARQAKAGPAGQPGATLDPASPGHLLCLGDAAPAAAGPTAASFAQASAAGTGDSFFYALLHKHP